MMTHRFLLSRRPPSQPKLTQQPANNPPAGRRAHRFEPSRQLAQRQVGPEHAGSHRSPAVNSCKTCRRFASSCGRLSVSGLRPPLFFRTRPAADPPAPPTPAAPLESSWDRTARRGRHIDAPCPSFVASMAAYRRRSFSDNHPKNRFIFRSTSAA